MHECCADWATKPVEHDPTVTVEPVFVASVTVTSNIPIAVAGPDPFTSPGSQLTVSEPSSAETANCFGAVGG